MSLEDLLGTPSGYASPQQIASVQQYADLLAKGGQRDKEITHPLQGLRMMADALSGNIVRNQAGQQQTASLGNAASQQMGVAQPPGAPQPSPQSAGGVDPQTARTFALESGGNPAAVTGSNRGLGQFGPAEEKKYGITDPMDPNQQASAMHQETAENVQGLTHALGRQPSPGEIYLAHQQGLAGATALLTNPQVPAWQAVRKFYPSDAVAQKAIAGNPPGGGHIDPNVPAGSFAGAWVKQFESKLGAQSPTGGQTADLSGHIGGNSPPQIGSPQAMSGALMAAGTGSPSGAEPPMAKSGDPTFGSQYAPSRPHIDPQKLQQFMANPWADPAVKQQMYQQYMMQYQPVEAAGPGGRWVIPSGGGKPLWIPELQKGDIDAGGVKVPFMGTVNPGAGGPEFKGMPGMPGIGSTPQAPPPDTSGLPDLHPGVSGTPAGPTHAPAPSPFPGLPDMHPGPQGSAAPQPGAPPAATAAQAASPMGQMAEAGAAPSAPPAPQGAQTASLGNGAVQSDAPPIGGMLGSPPPAMEAQKGPEGPQVAQSSGALPSLEQLRDFKLNMDQKGELNKEDVKKYTDNSNAVIQGGTQAVQAMPMIEMAKKAVQDPNYYSGIGSGLVLDLKKLKSAVGNDPNAAAATEVFTKAMSGDILGQLRAKLQGLGQVRLAEINLLTQATANLHNTPAANLAVLNIIQRGYQQMATMSQIAAKYNAGARLSPNGDWVRGNDVPSNAGLEDTLQKYLTKYPTFSPDEIAQFSKTLGIDEKPKAVSSGHPQPMATPAPGFEEAPPPPPGFGPRGSH